MREPLQLDADARPSGPGRPRGRGASGDGLGPLKPFQVAGLLFFLTALSTTYVGGPVYGLTIMSILVAHEMGHYLVARHYGVPASPPYFIPLPFKEVTVVGTLGAVIGMRTDRATRNELMDIGAAGPICGFLVAVPAMIVGTRLSVPGTPDPKGALHLGDSILSFAIARAFGPDLAAGQELMAHPMLMGSWAGFLVTAMNLFPMGQLDGGHVLFALAPERAERWSRQVFRGVVGLSAAGFLVHVPQILASVPFGVSVPPAVFEAVRPLYPWFTYSFLLFALVGRATGLAHPPVREADVPLTPRRRATAFVCLAIFALTFMPNPLWADDVAFAPPPAEQRSPAGAGGPP